MFKQYKNSLEVLYVSALLRTQIYIYRVAISICLLSDHNSGTINRFASNMIGEVWRTMEIFLAWF